MPRVSNLTLAACVEAALVGAAPRSAGRRRCSAGRWRRGWRSCWRRRRSSPAEGREERLAEHPVGRPGPEEPVQRLARSGSRPGCRRSRRGRPAARSVGWPPRSRAGRRPRPVPPPARSATRRAASVAPSSGVLLVSPWTMVSLAPPSPGQRHRAFLAVDQRGRQLGAAQRLGPGGPAGPGLRRQHADPDLAHRAGLALRPRRRARGDRQGRRRRAPSGTTSASSSSFPRLPGRDGYGLGRLSIIRRQPVSRERGSEPPVWTRLLRQPVTLVGRIGLRNWRVRSKLIAVLVIPAVAFLVLASFGIGSLVGNAQAFEEGRSLAELGRQVTALVHELQAGTRPQRRLHRQRRQGRRQRADASSNRGSTRPSPPIRRPRRRCYDDLGDQHAEQVRRGPGGAGRPVRAPGICSGPLPLPPGVPSRPSTRGSSTSSSTSTPRSPRRVGTRAFRSRCGPSTTCHAPRRSPPRCAASCMPWPSRRTSSSAASRSFSGLLARQQAAFQEFQADANTEQRGLVADVVQGQAVLQVNRIQQDGRPQPVGGEHQPRTVAGGQHHQHGAAAQR